MEETAFQALSLSAPTVDEEWLSFADYSNRVLICCKNQSDDSTCVNSIIPAIADTRCPVCIAELLFACSENHSCDATCVHSSGYVHGRLSQGSYYASTLNNSVDGNVQDVHVGKEVRVCAYDCYIGLLLLFLVSYFVTLVFIRQKTDGTLKRRMCTYQLLL